MIAVVPLAGTWIETVRLRCRYPMQEVVPLVRTWIETSAVKLECIIFVSFPSWESDRNSIEYSTNTK